MEVIRETDGIKIIDHSEPRTFLIESTDKTVNEISDKLPEWVIGEEQFYEKS